MKVCYLSSARIPVDWAHVLQILHMCEAYALEGHEVTLVCPAWHDPVSGDDAYAYAGVRPNFKIVRLPRLDFFYGSPHPLWYWLRTISFLLVARLYLWFVRYDLLVTRDYAALLLFSDCIYEIHTPPKVKTARESLLSRARGLAVLTSGIRDFYTERGIEPARIHISPDAVDPAAFEVSATKRDARERLGIDQDAYVAGYVGTLKAVGLEKGIGTVIEAMREVRPGTRAYVFGGEPDQVAEYEARAAAAGVGDRIVFKGKIPHADVPLAMRAFDCALVPLLDLEVFRLYTSPLKVFEYMAAGVPMIVSDLPSLRDVLDEHVATFVTPGDSHALAQALDAQRADGSSSQAMAERALTLVRERYTWRARARGIVDFANRMRAR